MISWPLRDELKADPYLKNTAAPVGIILADIIDNLERMGVIPPA